MKLHNSIVVKLVTVGSVTLRNALRIALSRKFLVGTDILVKKTMNNVQKSSKKIVVNRNDGVCALAAIVKQTIQLTLTVQTNHLKLSLQITMRSMPN